jgi:hypothetical protein
MADNRKGTPRPFQANLFSSSPTSLTGLNLSGENKPASGPIPFIVPQNSSTPDPFQQQLQKKDPSRDLSPSNRPPSDNQGLSQIDLSDEIPSEDPRDEQRPETPQQQQAIFSAREPVMQLAAPALSSAELEISGDTDSSLKIDPGQTVLHGSKIQQTPSPGNMGSPQTTSQVNPADGAGYNPYRAQNLHRPTHQPAYILPTPSQQFVPVPEPLRSTEPVPFVPPEPQPEIHQMAPQPMYTQQQQQPVFGQESIQPYWFYVNRSEYWTPFSRQDSSNIETAHISDSGLEESYIIPTDGGRYDVCLARRTRQSVYWEEPVSEIRRCTWFYKGESDRFFVPYQEEIAEKLESEYQSAVLYHVWNRRVELGDDGYVIMHNSNAILHHAHQTNEQMDFTIDDQQSRPRVVKRGFDEMEHVYEGEFAVIDHVVFIVHGLGPAADSRHQSVIDCVDDFRHVSELMLHSHEMPGRSQGGRVEFLPVCWQSALSQDPCIVDGNLKEVRLNSISRLRDFNNHSMIDLLFYYSPLYAQVIVKQIVQKMNQLLTLFLSRNQTFAGTVSVMGHSLGACVLFDILSNQKPPGEIAYEDTPKDNRETVKERASIEEELAVPVATIEEALQQIGLMDLVEKLKAEKMDMDSLVMCNGDDLKELGIPLGPRKKILNFITEQAHIRDEAKRREAEAKALAEQKARKAAEEEAKRLALEGTLEPGAVRDFAFRKLGPGIGELVVKTQQLDFSPANLFTCGSPVGHMLAMRGDTDRIGSEYSLPTCHSVLNIFHPYDPMASRLEPLVEPMLKVKPFLVPHHKGRKRFHLGMINCTKFELDNS